MFRVRFRVSINGARPKKHRQTHQRRTQAQYATPSTKSKKQQQHNMHAMWATYVQWWSWVGIYGCQCVLLDLGACWGTGRAQRNTSVVVVTRIRTMCVCQNARKLRCCVMDTDGHGSARVLVGRMFLGLKVPIKNEHNRQKQKKEPECQSEHGKKSQMHLQECTNATQQFGEK